MFSINGCNENFLIYLIFTRKLLEVSLFVGDMQIVDRTCGTAKQQNAVPFHTLFSVKNQINMKLAIATLLAGSAAAFAPAQTGRVATDLAVSELELGVTEPLGVYDPLGWLDTQPESFERRRAVERKHGRIAMAAVVGVVLHNNHVVFDGYISKSLDLKFSDIPTGVDGIRAIP